MVENSMENDMDLFNEIKKSRRKKNEEEVNIDGASGQAIPEAFASVNRNLYNQTHDEEKVRDIMVKVDNMIDDKDVIEVNNINGITIKDALMKIKSGKTDPTYGFSSDCLKNANNMYYECLASMMRAILIHGHIPSKLLTATLVPLVKDKLGDLGDSKNYRPIAISSLILKLLDWIIINHYGHLLKTNEFQFGFQPFSSTTLCSWIVFETIDSYLQHGSSVYG